MGLSFVFGPPAKINAILAALNIPIAASISSLKYCVLTSGCCRPWASTMASTCLPYHGAHRRTPSASTVKTRLRPSAFSACRARRISCASNVCDVQAVPARMRVAFMLAAIGTNFW